MPDCQHESRSAAIVVSIAGSGRSRRLRTYGRAGWAQRYRAQTVMTRASLRGSRPGGRSSLTRQGPTNRIRSADPRIARDRSAGRVVGAHGHLRRRATGQRFRRDRDNRVRTRTNLQTVMAIRVGVRGAHHMASSGAHLHDRRHRRGRTRMTDPFDRTCRSGSYTTSERGGRKRACTCARSTPD